MEQNLDRLEAQFFETGKQGYILPRLVTYEGLVYAFYSAEKMAHDLEDSFNRLSDPEKLQVFHRHMVWSIFSLNGGKYYQDLKIRLITYFEKRYGSSETIDQIIRAYEYKLYYPCICGAITLAEKLLSNTDRPRDITHERLLRAKLEKLYESENKTKENILLKANITGYIQFLYKSISFSNEEPKDINRNWLLHGRMDRSVSEDDCLNIFLLLDTLVELNEKIEV